jgi:hypothetical protein
MKRNTKPPAPPRPLEAFSEQWLAPQKMAVALAGAVRDYVRDVQAGRIFSPPLKRVEDGALALWRDLRLEALLALFGIETADPFLLADRRAQSELLACYLDRQSHAAPPNPRGDEMLDTVQAIRQVYCYLGDAGAEAGDRTTDSAVLEPAGKSILDHLTAEAILLREQWEAFERAIRAGKKPLPDMPPTLIEALVADVAVKARSIALSAAYGPDYEPGDNAEIDRLLAAKDPDEVRG